MTTPGFLTPFWESDMATRLASFDDIRLRSGGVEFHEHDTGRGFWSVTSHADVRSVTRDSETYTSTKGFSLDDFPPEMLEIIGSIIAMDDPRHQRQRKLVQAAFSPRSIKQMSDYVAELSDEIVEQIRTGERDFDFVSTVGAHLPLQVICDLLDIPKADRPRLRRLIDVILGVNDADFGDQAESAKAAIEFYSYNLELGKERRRNPGDDIISLLMQAEIDGKRLTPEEFGSFVILLASAGNDTTRTGLSWAMKLLSDHPDQRRALAARYPELHDNAIEEILRWSSPVLHMRRTANVDTTLGGQRIAQGDKVVVWYVAANHDPAVFTDPHTFDIRRPNARDQIAFGAGGPHFCLGANLAKMEIRVVLEKLLAAFPDIHTTAEPRLLISPFVNGIKSLPCAV